MGIVVEVQPQRSLPSTLPPYGLPYDFIPLAEVVLEIGQYFQQVVSLSVYTDAHPIIHITALPTAYIRHVLYFDYQHQLYHTTESTVNSDKVKYEDFREVKEDMQLLEKKFRAIEGDHVFGTAAKEMCLVSRLVISTKFKTHILTSTRGILSRRSISLCITAKWLPMWRMRR